MKTTLATLRNLASRGGLALGLAAGALLLAAGVETGRVHALNSRFTFLGALSNVLTPNGDGLNDLAFFCFDNPKASEVTGTVYDLHGKKVAGMIYVQSSANCQDGAATVEKLTWDGKKDGAKVSGGVYVYQIQSEGLTITGTVMVVR